MNAEQRGIVVGMVIGDGHIRTATAADKKNGRRIAAQISFAHSFDQKEYAQRKVDVLNSIFGGKATLRDGVYQGYRRVYAAKSNPYFKTLKGMVYRDGKKYISSQVLSMLTPAGIAYWFMDDGSFGFRRNENGKITSVVSNLATCASREEVDRIISFFLEKHGVESKPAFHKGSKTWCIRMNTKGTKQFDNLIRKYMHHSMLYKLDPDLHRHELLGPDLECVSCGKKVRRLSGKRMCNACYLRNWYADKKAVI